MEIKEQYLLEAKNLSKYFPVKNFFGKTIQQVKAVDRVSLSIKRGETFGLVGESGCGKSTLGRTLIRMYEPTDGTLIYDGDDITKILIKKEGMTGFELSEKLYEEFDIEDEKTNEISTMLLCGIGTDERKLAHLEHALKKC